MPLLVHSGTSEPNLKHLTVHLGAMKGDTAKVTCRYADTGVLDPGYVLEHDGELVQVTNVVVSRVALMGGVEIARGYGGTTNKAHPEADWEIVNAPPLGIGHGCTIPLDETKRTDCNTCGAPGQVVGERCHYCVHVVKEVRV